MSSTALPSAVPVGNTSNALSLLAVFVGGALMMWPALFNGYPMLYSDTNAFLDQGVLGKMIWDKPFVYGPWLLALHWKTSLWFPCAVQALLLSAMIWLARAVVAPPGATRHVLICAALAILTAAPWFASLLMPDIFASITVLGIYILAFGDRLRKATRLAVCVVTALAVGVHLTHLLIAAGAIAVIALLRPNALLRTVIPVIIAVAVIGMANIAAFGRIAVSPFGSVFLLARLATDGPAARTIVKACPESGWHMCGWINRLPLDSDDFLWDGKGPVWSHPGGPIGLSAEADAIVRKTLLSEPMTVLTTALENTLRQLQMIALGDTLRPQWVEGQVGNTIGTYFPPREIAAYRASRQATETLEPAAARLNTVHLAVILAGLIASIALLVNAMLRRDRTIMALVLMVLIAIAINAFATGALSRPHYRYQTRIAWLLVLVPLITIPRQANTRRQRAGAEMPQRH